MLFRDRKQAGELLARRLADEGVGGPDALVLALPRGGVPVAAPIARALGCELDVFLVRKLGVPGQDELAMGAIASGGTRTLNQDVVDGLNIDGAVIDAVARRELAELERRQRAYRGDRPYPAIADRTVIVVDDGLATGASMRAAVQALRMRGPAELVVAVPVGSNEACAELSGLADRVVCLASPRPFHGVGLWYADFRQTSDEDVLRLLIPRQVPCVTELS